jgi:pre-mRNA-processing factor 6
MKASLLEEKYGTPESLDCLLSQAVQNCPRAWQLWLKYAKEKWLRNDVVAARKILASAFEANSDNEEIWLAAVKLENRANEVERARLLLQRARDKASTERVWMKSALFEREHGAHYIAMHRVRASSSSSLTGDYEAERNLVLKAVEKFPNFAKLHMMLVQVHVHFGDSEAARQAYNRAVTLCPKSVNLWIVAAHMEQAVGTPYNSSFIFFANASNQSGSFTRARSVLERARQANDANPILWLETIRNETSAGEERLALTRMSQVCVRMSNSLSHLNHKYFRLFKSVPILVFFGRRQFFSSSATSAKLAASTPSRLAKMIRW